MPAFKPSVLFDDAYGSIGDITFFHRYGKCFYRKRSHSAYPGTAAQTSALDVHRRALAAWRTVPHGIQKMWNHYAMEVEPHKPPFDHLAYISGQNLFVSAYHGFYTLGDEHIPSPQRFAKFPPFAAALQDARKENGALIIPAVVSIHKNLCPEKYRLLTKVQLAEPGKGCHPGLMRNFLTDGYCSDDAVFIVIPGYRDIWGFELGQYQVHIRFILLDIVTGYRSQYQQNSFLISAR